MASSILRRNGDRWSKETEADFVKFVTEGGGLVVIHAADNSFAPETLSLSSTPGAGAVKLGPVKV